MEFFIKQNATLPTLKLQVVKDGRNDFRSFMETLQNAIITFSMVNTDNGILKIASKPAYITEKFFDNLDAPQEFYIYYNFTANDTKTPGRYMGEFSITTTEGELIVPIRESLFINITPSFIKTQYCC
jgi:hypothetical protein